MGLRFSPSGITRDNCPDNINTVCLFTQNFEFVIILNNYIVNHPG